jgi:hypothetical protein
MLKYVKKSVVVIKPALTPSGGTPSQISVWFFQKPGVQPSPVVQVQTTEIVWLTVVDEWLPQASVASQLRVSLIEPAHVPALVTSDTKLTVAPPHASEAVGGVKFGVAEQLNVASAPAEPRVGPCVSTTVMV